MNQKSKDEKEVQSIKIREASESGKDPVDSGKPDIAAILPLRGHVKESIDYNPVLIRKCLESLNESTEINRFIISADDEKLLAQVEKHGTFESVIRPEHLSKEGVRVQDVLQYTLKEIVKTGPMPDLVLPVEITYPFRPTGLFDNLIHMYREGNYDTVIAGVPEYRVCWKEEADGFVSVTDLSVARSKRKPLYIGLPSLGCVIEPQLVLDGKRYGSKLGILQVEEPFASVEIRTPTQLKHIAQQLYWPVD